jgi:hypothetical protein
VWTKHWSWKMKQGSMRLSSVCITSDVEKYLTRYLDVLLGQYKIFRMTLFDEFDVHGSMHRKCIFERNQQGATLHNVFISAKCSTCFRRVLHPSSGAQNCIHSIGYLAGLTATCRCRRVGNLPWQQQAAVKPCKYLMQWIQFWAPDDGRRTRLKHVEHFAEINTLCNVAYCWLYWKIKIKWSFDE